SRARSVAMAGDERGAAAGALLVRQRGPLRRRPAPHGGDTRAGARARAPGWPRLGGVAPVLGRIPRRLPGRSAMSLQLQHAAAPARWRPTTTLMGSIGLHCAAGVGSIVQPEMWPWAVGAIAANH